MNRIFAGDIVIVMQYNEKFSLSQLSLFTIFIASFIEHLSTYYVGFNLLLLPPNFINPSLSSNASYVFYNIQVISLIF